MFKAWQSITLWKRVLLGLVFGLAVGLLLRYAIPLPDFTMEVNGKEKQIPGAEYIGEYVIYPFGKAFVRLIKMLIVPLIATTPVSYTHLTLPTKA